MSTKTISKRIALATVVALGAGVLSLVTVSSANAAHAFSIAVSNPDGLTASAGTSGAGTPYSVGLLGAPVVSGLLSTATLAATGTITVGYTPTTDYAGISVTGGTISAYTVANTGAIVTGGTYFQAQGAGAVAVSIKPNAGVATMTIQASRSNLTTATSGGTLEDQVIVSVAASATSGTVSLSKSGVFYDAPGTGTQAAVSADSTSAGVGTSAYGVSQSATIVAKDAYSVYVAASSLVTASATNGAYVALTQASATTSQGASPAAVGTISSAYALTYGAYPVGMIVSAPSTAPVTTTVTVSVNGVVLGTKAFTFTGSVAKVTLSAPSNGVLSTGGTTTLAFADSAGNAIYPGTPAGSYPQNLVKDAATAGAGIALSTVVYPVSGTAGSAAFTCGAINSTGNLSVDYTNADGTIVVSNSVPITCSSTPASYTAKFDKSSYNPGDIATLTVTFKDSTGALAADVAGAIAASGANIPNIVGSNLTNTSGTLLTAGTLTDVTTNGVATYKFIVVAPASGTSGSYQAIVDFPKVDSATQSGLTVPYSIGSSGTSLNDVLKGIVSLIASINKQIAALAKLVAKKK